MRRNDQAISAEGTRAYQRNEVRRQRRSTVSEADMRDQQRAFQAKKGRK